ncbi:MAG: hypothetical protein IH622_06070 [Ochrobactrum anthropi]|uniref:DUF4376 domain-containing protein n=1 Tax=Brucella anthropi TaxID=529 RepID=A0A8I0N479_BRUAN|nr:hypothetical protein [Brucella anthropi]MBE0560377.1 hypothetical protein [Brucella anthropi]
MNYDPKSWYWLADDGRLFSSAKGREVEPDHPDFIAWKDGGNAPTRWPESDDGVQTDAALDDVLRVHGLTCLPVSLSDIKAKLKSEIDRIAEIERLNYITPGNGQAMTYQQKVSEAQAFKAATNPKTSDYPILSSEVGITAGALGEVADIVLAAFAQWQQIGAAIEAIRLGAKRDIDAAEDETSAGAIVDAIVWPSAQVLS